MLQRLAFMKLHNALRGGSDTVRQRREEGLRILRFEDTLLEPSSHPPLLDEELGGSFVFALKQLSETPDVAGRPVDEVAPIEKLDLLIRLASRTGSLSNRVLSGRPGEKEAIEAVAQTLIDPKAPDIPAQVAMLLQAIDKADQQVILIPDLEDETQFARITGPRPPRAASRGPDTVADVLGAVPGLRLVDGLADHPVVVVDSCVYKTMVGEKAEYAVHLRTTISFKTPRPTVADLKHLLEPEKWPDFNPFWLGMKEIPPPPPKGLEGAPLPDDAPPTPEQEATIRANPYIAHVHNIGWESLGTFHEQVGFDGPNNGGPVGEAGGVKDDRGLYPNTYLYFSRTKDIAKRPVLTYTLLRRLPPLCIDDGCIEITPTDEGVDVITTKSLYVDGVGSDTELAGILAYMAAFSGWGTNTLLLVSNAAQEQ